MQRWEDNVEDEEIISDLEWTDIVENIEIEIPVWHVCGVNWSMERKLREEHGITTVQELYNYYQEEGDDELEKLVEECGGNRKRQRKDLNTLRRREERLEECEIKEKIFASRLWHKLDRCRENCAECRGTFTNLTKTNFYYFYHPKH